MRTDPRKSASLICLIVFLCFGYAQAQTEQVKLKLADGSYMTVDDAWESPQGVWYRRGGLSHLLAKEKVKKIERSTPESTPEPAAKPSTNDDDHFEVPEMVAKAHALNLTVTSWTFSTNEKITQSAVRSEMSHFLYELGIDALFTNNPDQFPRR